MRVHVAPQTQQHHLRQFPTFRMVKLENVVFLPVSSHTLGQTGYGGAFEQRGQGQFYVQSIANATDHLRGHQ